MLNAFLPRVRGSCGADGVRDVASERDTEFLRLIHDGVVGFGREVPIDFDKSPALSLKHPHSTSCCLRSRNAEHVRQLRWYAIHDTTAGGDAWAKHVTCLN